MWVVVLIGRAKWEICCNNQEHYPDLGSDATSVMEFMRLFLREISGNVAKF